MAPGFFRVRGSLTKPHAMSPSQVSHRRSRPSSFSSELTPSEAVTRAIETGIGIVDLSRRSLASVPEDVFDLKCVVLVNPLCAQTPVHQPDQCSLFASDNSVQLYLWGNEISAIDLRLFELSNLTVLSLAKNNIKTLPPEIVHLQNLVELNLGNNQFETLPSQLCQINPSKLRLTTFPNPLFRRVPAVIHDNESNINNQDSMDIDAESVPTLPVPHRPQILSFSPPASLQQLDPPSNTISTLTYTLKNISPTALITHIPHPTPSSTTRSPKSLFSLCINTCSTKQIPKRFQRVPEYVKWCLAESRLSLCGGPRCGAKFAGSVVTAVVWGTCGITVDHVGGIGSDDLIPLEFRFCTYSCFEEFCWRGCIGKGVVEGCQ